MRNVDDGGAEMLKSLIRSCLPSQDPRLHRDQRENDRFHTPVLINFTNCPGLLGNHFKA